MRENALDVLFEAKLKHLVCLVEYHSSHISKVNISAFDVVEHAPSCAYENIDALPQLPCLVLYRNPSVHRQGVEFTWRVLDRLEYSLNLKQRVNFNALT